MATRDDVKAKVIRLLSVVSNMDEDVVQPPSKLRENLLLAEAMIKALASPYTVISKTFGGRRITISEASSRKTVGEVIALILGKLPQGTT